MTHIPVMTHFLVRRVMCRIQLRITHPAFGWWGLLIYSSIYDDVPHYALRRVD
jgi:NADH:ubiquinone oxidoreductase subunit H